MGLVVLAACYMAPPPRSDPAPPPPGGGGEIVVGAGVTPPPTIVVSGGATVVASGTTPPPASAAHSCGQDEIFEMQCGGGCGPTGEALTAYGKTRVAVTYTNQLGHDATLRGLPLDDAETKIYRDELAAGGAAHLDTYCCYSRCTHLSVFAAIAPLPAKPGYRVGSHCIPAPPAGTSHPAAANPRCPAALDVIGGVGGYVGGIKPAGPGQGNMWWYRGEAESCCYETYVKDIPPNFGHCPTCKCAAAGTPIATPAGEVPIESLAVGDVVLDGTGRPARLLQTHREPVHDHVMVVVTLANGRTLAMSPRHPTGDGRIFEHLEAGQLLGDERILTLRREPYAGAYTYDLLTPSGTYLAAGAVVGSTLTP